MDPDTALSLQTQSSQEPGTLHPLSPFPPSPPYLRGPRGSCVIIGPLIYQLERAVRNSPVFITPMTVRTLRACLHKLLMHLLLVVWGHPREEVHIVLAVELHQLHRVCHARPLHVTRSLKNRLEAATSYSNLDWPNAPALLLKRRIGISDHHMCLENALAAGVEDRFRLQGVKLGRT